jgi:Ca2+-binding EF-hand superfamily protein
LTIKYIVAFNYNYFAEKLTMNLSQVSDQQLMQYINDIFIKYDRDHSGGLDALELSKFFTDMYHQMGYNVTISYPQAQQALATIDTNFDGKASRQ